MKRISSFVLSLCLTIGLLGLLTACGSSYDAETSTVYILSSGKVILTEVEVFDEDTYDKDELLAFAVENINFYNTNAGEERVSIRKLAVKDGVATMVLEFDSADDFSAFTGYYLAYGTISELRAKGISLDGDFVSIDKKAQAAFCRTDEITNGKDYHVLIASGDFRFVVPGNIVYLSADGAKLLDRKSITIIPNYNILDAAKGDTDDHHSGDEDSTAESAAEGEDGSEQDSENTEGTENTENGESDAAATEVTGDDDTGSASDGSVSEDELLAVGEEEEVAEEEEEEEESYHYEAPTDDKAKISADDMRIFIIFK